MEIITKEELFILRVKKARQLLQIRLNRNKIVPKKKEYNKELIKALKKKYVNNRQK